MPTSLIQKRVFENLKANPFFFMRFEKIVTYDEDGTEHDESKYVTVDREIGISIRESIESAQGKDYILCLADINDSQVKQNDPNTVVLHFHNPLLNNLSDFSIVLNMYLKHMSEQEHRYAYLELLWLLNNEKWTENDIRNVLRTYNPNSIPSLCKVISEVGRCLSIKKQQLLIIALRDFGYNYSIYNPSIIQDALTKLNVDHDHYQSYNLYVIIDFILGKETPVTENTGGNPLLELKKWMSTDGPFANYQQLINIFSLVNEPTQLNIVKRLFHDIRHGHTTFDPGLLEQFKDNKFNEFIKYRYCIKSPGEPIILTVPLLCDNILTLFNTGGQNFLSFDGVLDFAITHCDTAHPNIEFKMNRFIPECNGGTQKNNTFCGFISYGLIYRLDESKLTDDIILSFAKRMFVLYGNKISYFICKWGDEMPLDDTQIAHCHSRREGRENDRTFKYECCERRYYDDRWLISKNSKIEFSIFLDDTIKLTEKECQVDLSMISVNKFIDYLHHLSTHFVTAGDNSFVVPPTIDNILHRHILETFFSIERMRISPNKTVVAGLKFDVFGIKKSLLESRNGEKNENRLSHDDRDAINNEHERLEAEEVHRRIKRALSNNYSLGEYSELGNFFETEYDAELLNEIKLKFYYKDNAKNNDGYGVRSFLESYRSPRFKPLCSPKLSDARNMALDIPFFWCKGRECFHNCLEHQTLSETEDWRNYTLFHLIEIIGFPKIHQTEAGNEPDDVVRQLVAVSNKVLQKFRRLKCRGCGHMMFTAKGRNGAFNNHNFYACANPNCTEYNKEVYLNHCFHCKKGLIDSRDHKKCPNGWHICPTCLSCCDNALFERLAQRYIVSNRPVPAGIQRLRGQGHADAGLRYCPHCGSQIDVYTDDHGDEHIGCPQCHLDFERF